MAEPTRHDKNLTTLHEMVKKAYNKRAELAQTNVSGVPGKDVKSESVLESTEKVNKNEVGADKNKPQEYSQEKAKDNQNSEPLAGAKKASVNDLGKEILSDLNKESELAQTNVSGTPGKDVKAESPKESTEHVNKNEVGADKNKPQEYSQDKAKDNQSSEPLAGAKKAEANVEEIAAKVASYEVGRQFAAALLKQATFQVKHASDYEMLKEAGRKDLEELIAKAQEELEYSAPQEDLAIKQAEQAGANYFDEILKQASIETVISQNQELQSKVAELERQVAESSKVASSTKQTLDKKASDEAALAEKKAQALEIANMVRDMLKTEDAK